MSLYEAALHINTTARAQRRPIARGGGNNAVPGPNFSSGIYRRTFQSEPGAALEGL